MRLRRNQALLQQKWHLLASFPGHATWPGNEASSCQDLEHWARPASRVYLSWCESLQNSVADQIEATQWWLVTETCGNLAVAMLSLYPRFCLAVLEKNLARSVTCLPSTVLWPWHFMWTHHDGWHWCYPVGTPWSEDGLGHSLHTPSPNCCDFLVCLASCLSNVDFLALHSAV